MKTSNETEFIKGRCESCGMAGDVRRCKLLTGVVRNGRATKKEHQLCLSCKKAWTGHGW